MLFLCLKFLMDFKFVANKFLCTLNHYWFAYHKAIKCLSDYVTIEGVQREIYFSIGSLESKAVLLWP